jgi:hypothetical protein
LFSVSPLLQYDPLKVSPQEEKCNHNKHWQNAPPDVRNETAEVPWTHVTHLRDGCPAGDLP